MRRHKKQCTIGSHFDVEILLKSRLSLLKSFPVSVRRSSWAGLESCLDSNFSCYIFFWVIEEESLLLHFVLLSLSINLDQNICTRWSTTHFGESQSFNWGKIIIVTNCVVPPTSSSFAAGIAAHALYWMVLRLLKGTFTPSAALLWWR